MQKKVIYEELINWPDGIFAKVLGSKLNKIPGRDIIRKLRIPDHINEITIMGNLSKTSKIFTKRFKKKINHISLPCTNFENSNKFSYKIKRNEIIFITLPTPKQKLAKYLKEKNLFFKIICIGGSINIASGEEKEVPRFFSKFEFLWRLRYDPIRRLNRLIKTFFAYFFAMMFTKNFKNKSAKII